jgi:hypothetical protein
MLIEEGGRVWEEVKVATVAVDPGNVAADAVDPRNESLPAILRAGTAREDEPPLPTGFIAL